MSNQIRELIAIGASVAGNCLPCLRYHFAEAVKRGYSLAEIEEAIQLAKMGPIGNIYKLADVLIKQEGGRFK